MDTLPKDEPYSKETLEAAERTYQRVIRPTLDNEANQRAAWGLRAAFRFAEDSRRDKDRP